MNPGLWVRLCLRVYRAALRALPRDVRSLYGAAMQETFQQAIAGRSARTAVSATARECADLARTAISLRFSPYRSLNGAAMSSTNARSEAGLAGTLRDDATFAFRAVWRNRAFFMFAAATLALGIGASTAIFSSLKSIVLEPLPFPGGDRVVLPWRLAGPSMLLMPTKEQIEGMRGQEDVFEAVATFGHMSEIMTGSGDPVGISAVRMGRDLAAFMGMQPVIGRFFSVEEYAGEGAKVALLSYVQWQQRFAGQADAIGKTVHLSGKPWTVIGVMPPEAIRPTGSASPVDLWIPLGSEIESVQAIARLRPGVTIAAASERFAAVVKQDPDAGAMTGSVEPATMMRSGGLAQPLRVLMIAVSLLLLIACVNVSNLLLQRAASRQHEASIRIAIGSGRARLARQLLFESLILAAAGGLMGTALAWALVKLLVTMRPEELDALGLIRLDGTVLLFATAISFGAALLFGVGPAIHAARASAMAALGRAPRDGQGTASRVRWLLVGSEVALSFALLVGASLILGTFREYTTRDPGYRPLGLIDVHVTLPPWKYPSENPAVLRATFEELRATIGRVPGVQAVALSTGVPSRSGIYFGEVIPEGAPAIEGTTLMHGSTIDGDYLSVIGQPLISGRVFNAEDIRPGSQSVILGEAAAKLIFPDGNAVGRRFRFTSDTAITVVGVVRDITINAIRERQDVPIVYWPMKDMYQSNHLVVRAPDAGPETIAQLRSIVREREPDAILRIEKGESLEHASLASERLTTSLIGAFSVAALMLAAIGLYGVLARSVTTRTHEIGVRLSLGADSRSIGSMILGAGYRVTLAGLVAGALLAAGGLRLIGTKIFGLGEQRPAAYIAAAVVISIVSLAAMWIPAMRAARIDPMRAMRE